MVLATSHVSAPDRLIRRTTTVSVTVLALIAAVVSYGHLHQLALRQGEGAWNAALIPLSVDGMVLASSMTLLLESRLGRRGDALPWFLLVAGSAASLAANVAVAEPTVVGRVIAGWPSVAFVGAYELLQGQLRNAAVLAAEKDSRASHAEHDQRPREAIAGLSQTATTTPVGHSRNVDGRALQRRAWRWAQTNRAPDGSLPSGSALARTFQRSARWGRYVKTCGVAGEYG